MKKLLFIVGLFCITLRSLERPPRKQNHKSSNQKKSIPKASDRVYVRPPGKQSHPIQIAQSENNYAAAAEYTKGFEVEMRGNPGFKLPLKDRIREKLTEDDGFIDRMTACAIIDLF